MGAIKPQFGPSRKPLPHRTRHSASALAIATLSTITLAGIEELCGELRSKDYRFSKPGITKTEWGTLDMQIVDPFGNRLLFSEA